MIDKNETNSDIKYMKWFDKSLNKLIKLYKKDKEFFLKVAYQSSVGYKYHSFEKFFNKESVLVKEDVGDRLEMMIKDEKHLKSFIVLSKTFDFRNKINNLSLKELLDD
jgi:hypothetical protein